VEIVQVATDAATAPAAPPPSDRGEPMTLEQAWHRRNRELRRLDLDQFTAEIVSVEDGGRF